MIESRSLTLDEIAVLESSGCRADDWTCVRVAGDFSPEYIRRVEFHGDVYLGVFNENIGIDEGISRHSGISDAVLYDVTIGDNCLIENVGNYISRYVIGEECYISNVGKIAITDGATFGRGIAVPVLNEAGGGNVIIYDGLTSQMAAFMLRCAADKEQWAKMRRMVDDDIASRNCEIGYRVKITNTRELVNVSISDECEINGASRLVDCTLTGTPEAGIYIGHDVICENTIIQAGASVLDGAILGNCLVGEACHIGKGFSAENSVFFANSYMDNGEACAAFCGPFSVSHHKSTLLIGGQYSFYNAGSATNYSNHAYKMGPVHYGTLQRGSKTASGAHILMPANVGAFTMCMGKIENHPDTEQLPFSYLIASGGKTYIVPGCNLATVGTYRDISKWPKRDMRPLGGRRSIVNMDWLSPYVMQNVVRGKRLLESLRMEQGENQPEYTYDGCVISGSSLVKGIMYYDIAIRMCLGEMVERHGCELPDNSIGTGEWTDLAGLIVPESEVEQMTDDIASGDISEIADIDDRMEVMHEMYSSYKWNCVYRAVLDYYDLDTITDEDVGMIVAEGKKARAEWLSKIRHDAEKEFAMGDVDEELLDSFVDGLV